MTPADIKSARKALGLSQSGLAEALRLGPNGDRTVRRWERGEVAITGPASLALELLLERNVKLTTLVKTDRFPLTKQLTPR